MKKLLPLLLVLLLLAGCGATSTPPASSAAPAGDAAPASSDTAPADDAAPAEQIELTIAAIPGAPSNMLQMNKAIFEEKHPEVTVTITEYAEDQLQNQAPQLWSDQANKPDLSWYWANQFWYADMCETGMFMPLNDMYESEGWTAALGQNMVDSYTSPDGNIYAVCNAIVWVPNLYYNKTIFEEQGIEIPKTQDELYAIAEKLNAAGIVPIAVGATEAVPDHCFNGIMQRTVTPEEYDKMLDITTKYDGLYNSPGVIRAFEELKKMSELVYQPGATGVNSTEARSMFLQGKAAMHSDGSWAAGLIGAEKPAEMEVGAFQYPQIDASITPKMLLFNGNSMQIHADTDQPELAKEFLAQLMSAEGQGEMAAQAIDSPSRTDVPDIASKMGNIFGDMYADMASMGTVNLWWSSQDGEIVNKMYDIVSSVMAGGTEPAAAAEELQALYESSFE